MAALIPNQEKKWSYFLFYHVYLFFFVSIFSTHFSRTYYGVNLIEIVFYHFKS